MAWPYPNVRKMFNLASEKNGSSYKSKILHLGGQTAPNQFQQQQREQVKADGLYASTHILFIFQNNIKWVGVGSV